MKFFSAGELDTPMGLIDVGLPGRNDNANQSACGIPDNAWNPEKVAIHPYFLKYAGLDRTSRPPFPKPMTHQNITTD